MKTYNLGVWAVALAMAMMAMPALVYGQTDCPENSLFGQAPTPPPPDGEPRIWGSDELLDYMVSLGALEQSDVPIPFDDFAVSGPIGALEWWGTEMDLNEIPALRHEDLFTITFYENDTTSYPDPMPGAVSCVYEELPVTKTDTGILYMLFIPLYHYSVELPAPCMLSEGWISIKGSLSGSLDPTDPTDPDKARGFVQISSTEGNETMREYDGENLPYRVRNGGRRDMAFCLIEAEMPVTVPDVVGEQQDDAETAIVAAGLTVGAITYDYSGVFPAGQVTSQAPAALEEVPSGTAVDLVVAVDPVVVPDVVNMQEANASAAISGAGLAVGAKTRVFSDTAPEGQVIAQSIAAGESVGPGTAINLTISRGPEPSMPAAGFAALAALTAILGGMGITRRRRKR